MALRGGRCCDECNESALVPALLLRVAAAEKKAKREGNGNGSGSGLREISQISRECARWSRP
jgi:hypothetical protein